MEMDELLERAANMVSYDADTGVMTWNHKQVAGKEEKRWNSRYAGKECGIISNKGYLVIGFRFGGRKFGILTHRLAYFIANLVSPCGEIDHIDRDKLNNRSSNLRDVPKAVNLKNRPLQKNNTSGITGVRWRADIGKWQARSIIAKKEIHLGYFAGALEAEKAVKEFRSNHGFTSNHGEAS